MTGMMVSGSGARVDYGEALLPVPEDFPDAEERRLLYVALTRARHRVWLLFNKDAPSRLLIS
jgi:superfamily I DNA/RNA helicase